MIDSRPVPALIPTLNLEPPYAIPPTLDVRWHRCTLFSHIYTQHMREQFLGLAPFVPSKLPCLPCSKHGDDAGPVVGFELLGGIDDDEAVWFLGQTSHVAREMQKVGGCLGGEGRVVEGDVEAGIEEGFDVGHSE